MLNRNMQTVDVVGIRIKHEISMNLGLNSNDDERFRPPPTLGIWESNQCLGPLDELSELLVWPIIGNPPPRPDVPSPIRGSSFFCPVPDKLQGIVHHCHLVM